MIQELLAPPLYIYRNEDHNLEIVLFGGQTHSPLTAAALYAKQRSLPVTCVTPPSNASESGFQTVVTLQSDTEIIRADGAVIKRQRALLMCTRDCPVLVLSQSAESPVSVTHCGRPALTPSECSTCGYSVVVPALAAVAPRNKPELLSEVHAHIGGSICQAHFPHDAPGAEAYVAPFRQARYPAHIVGAQGELDLVGVITHELTARGVTRRNIVHDRLCTFNHPRLGSHRQGDASDRSNVTLVLAY